MLLPTNWFPQDLMRDFMGTETPSAFHAHLMQEFGTVMAALGAVFLLFSKYRGDSRSFHWAMTGYFFLDALIHWIGPGGLIGSWRRGIVNSIPFAVMLLLGLLQWRASRTKSRE